MTANDRIYYAHKTARGDRAVYFHASPNRRWVELHGLRDPIVALRLREWREGDPECRYWAWVYAERPDEFVFVWPMPIRLPPKECASHEGNSRARITGRFQTRRSAAYDAMRHGGGDGLT